MIRKYNSFFMINHLNIKPFLTIDTNKTENRKYKNHLSEWELFKVEQEF